MAFDEGLAERLRQMVEGMPGITEKRMFGGWALMRHGHMFVGIVDERLMARIGPDAAARALERPAVAAMDFTGKPMKGYVFVHPNGTEADEDLRHWVDLALGFVDALPPKNA